MKPRNRSYQLRGVVLQAGLEGVALASFRRRSFAILIDAVLIVIVTAGCKQLFGSTEHGEERTLTIASGGYFSTFLFLVYFSVVTWLGHGRTLGKTLMGIRVVSIVHDHLGFWHCVERALGYAASTLEAGFGFIQYFTHPNCQTVHDRIAETIVIAERRSSAVSTIAS